MSDVIYCKICNAEWSKQYENLSEYEMILKILAGHGCPECNWGEEENDIINVLKETLGGQEADWYEN